MQIGDFYDQDYGAGNCGIITKIETVSREYGKYQLIFYKVDGFPSDPDACDVYRLSDGPDLLIGFVSFSKIYYWAYFLYPEETWDVKLDVTVGQGIEKVIRKSEEELEAHFNQLYPVG
jgi:hypothetical protein